MFSFEPTQVELLWLYYDYPSNPHRTYSHLQSSKGKKKKKKPQHFFKTKNFERERVSLPDNKELASKLNLRSSSVSHRQYQLDGY